MLECVLLRIKSPVAYKHLRENKILPLPHPKTIQKLLSGEVCKFGFSSVALDAIEREMLGKKRQHRQGVLIFDEIQLRETLDFNKGSLKFDGFIDFAEYTDELLEKKDFQQLADHALVFMYRPFNGSWVNLNLFLSLT